MNGDELNNLRGQDKEEDRVALLFDGQWGRKTSLISSLTMTTFQGLLRGKGKGKQVF